MKTSISPPQERPTSQPISSEMPKWTSCGVRESSTSMAVWMTIFMFSMAGIPPLAGFFGKMFVFKAAIDAGLWTLAIVGVLSSVVSAFYYLRIVKVMFFDESAGALDARPAGVSFVMAAAGLFNVLFFLYPAPLVAASTSLTNCSLFLEWKLNAG